MAEEVEALWGEDLQGLVVAPHGSEVSLKSLDVRTAAHPYPDEQGAASASALLRALQAVPEGEDVLFLLSGGASSLLLATEDGPRPDQLAQATKALLNGGADIHALNTVRRVLSPLLGGGAALPDEVQRLVPCHRVHHMHQVGGGEGDATRHAGKTVDQDATLGGTSAFNEIKRLLEEGLHILAGEIIDA